MGGRGLGIAGHGEGGKCICGSIGQDVGFRHHTNCIHRCSLGDEVLRPARSRPVHIGGINAEQRAREVVLERGKSASNKVGLLNRENLGMVIQPS